MCKQNFKTILLVLLVIFTGACEQASIEQAAGKNVQLHALFDEYRDANFELNPINAMFEGDYRFNDRFGDGLSEQYLTDSLALEQEFLNKLRAIDRRQLNSQDQLSHEIFEYDRLMAIENLRDGYARLETLMPVTQFFSTPSFVALLGTGTSAQPFNTVEDYDNWLRRLGGFIPWVDQAIGNMRIGISEGVVLPGLIVERVLPLLQAHIVDDVQDSVFYQPLKNFPDNIPEQSRERLIVDYENNISNKVIPAYKRLHTFMAEEYLPHARASHGIGALPGGKEWYVYQARYHTTTDLTPEQIHEIGKAYAGELFKEIESIKNTVGFEGDVKAFFQFLRTDPQFYFDEPEQLVQSYRDLRTDIEQRLPRLFDLIPESEYVIKPIEEFRAASSAAAHYMSPAPDGSRPAVFYVNTYDVGSRSNWEIESLFIHEAVPGHHFQIALAQEQENLPAFRRFGGQTAYVEGWALYAETLGEELGLYTDPYQRLGALSNDIWRANRLVVDTGLHALGWTREQAIEWMESNIPITHTNAVAEVERYMVIPGQALAYKIGQIKIRELRRKAEDVLGDRFDIKAFHRQVLADGSMPLTLLERKIANWISSQGS